MSEWKRHIWQDRHNHPVKTIIFHESELPLVNMLPFPQFSHTKYMEDAGEPSPDERFFRRSRYKAGDTFTFDSGWGPLPATVTEIDRNWRYHYHFYIPGETEPTFCVAGWSNGAFLERPALGNEILRAKRIMSVMPKPGTPLLEAPNEVHI